MQTYKVVRSTIYPYEMADRYTTQKLQSLRFHCSNAVLPLVRRVGFPFTYNGGATRHLEAQEK